jgi:3-oxoacyl-[acyl-carrier protein] reductase
MARRSKRWPMLDPRWGGVQVLVNNAVLTRAVPVLDITLDDWDR